jgi:outer membrane lipoprotein SlyB
MLQDVSMAGLLGMRIAAPSRGRAGHPVGARTTTGETAMTTPSGLRQFQLALVASAAVALVACSKNDADVAPPVAATSAPTSVATAPVPAPAPVAATPAPAPVVVAQNDRRAYEQGRHDQARRDANREARELPPRADRDTDAGWRHDPQVAAAACADCGVVEAVNVVEVQGPNNGVGAVAGGVGGALVGSQIAGGHNRTVGGLVGAVGGGLLGNAIEKHERRSTMYDVTVRMADGSRRVIREATAPAVGEKVLVQADGLHERT